MSEPLSNETINPIAKDEEDIFVLVIYGFEPAFYDDFAFRVDKSCKARKMKDVLCPYCKRKFDMVGEKTKVEVFRYSKKTSAGCHSFRNCKICHEVVGIKFA